MDLLGFLKPMPVIGILRDIPRGAEEACIKTALSCGLRAIEVTMNTDGAVEILRNLKTLAKPYDDLKVGAGTVRHISEYQKAVYAGAAFIVTPNSRKDVIKTADSENIPIIPGALTPTEVQKAYDLGATAVKIFPVNCVGGPEYIKALRGPYRDIPLLACGGVNAENAASYLKAGADLLAFGGSIFSPKLMAEGNWDEIGQRLKTLLDAVRAVIA
ncbi:MAG: bifunctional 4-hydroxy-2-oxoglutarate aldolase/2-dehydro-3-deoxy-phosphogluconate aldolase [Fibrobacter sp.]|nr:bifunctional 4-hydroxy-2-oxoglutarate aldolase/2-dehydro-3-deoxy-phosphogluconate aldolase [Fibrobacter sp.]MCQ2121496.1 bifunctional 4-hydroxy-2-oxoglutarate aldolase/2-dehydro-3-deoxy-phosphogluconate aldolase [Fibrobacter sp.]